MPALNSRHIAHAEFDSGILTVKFRDGSEYSYQDVDHELYRGLLEAESASEFFRAHIKNAHSYRRIL